MENKYYTPSIEEFHVGFEYETTDIMDNGEWGWRSRIFEGEETRTYFTEELQKKEHRVKYLDREDIESFGFTDYQRSVCDWYKLEGRFEDSFASYGYWSKIRLIHCRDRNKIKILAYEYSWDEQESVLFAGEIKNKSELKQLLKQLNIL